MIAKQNLLQAVSNSPAALRELLKEDDVIAALESLGIIMSIYELHAVSPDCDETEGPGSTLCKYNGRRHPTLVTCKKCLRKLEAD